MRKSYGKYLIAIGIILVAAFLFLIVLEDRLFSKAEAVTLLKKRNFVLQDDCSLVQNKSLTAIGDYYHTFTLQISERDKRASIAHIKAATDFQIVGEDVPDIDPSFSSRYNGPPRRLNYETNDSFVSEYFKPNGTGNAPTYIKISIAKEDNTLLFEDIDE